MTDLDTARTYSTHEVARLAGITYRQASHWAHHGVLGRHLAGEGQGSRLRWTAADTLALLALAAYTHLLHAITDQRRGGGTGITTVGPRIVDAVRACPTAEWLVVTADLDATAHQALPDAVRAVTLRGGLLVDLTATQAA